MSDNVATNESDVKPRDTRITVRWSDEDFDAIAERAKVESRAKLLDLNQTDVIRMAVRRFLAEGNGSQA
jgi:hypothetical protein